ncbi:serine/threonine protein kinase [Streptomyces sp. NPDC059575]|uniref:serine/threonine protein kinase n=1 Tax=Streptomyces sp. NPDC059575 TaxID=3346872 RepID=UPI0036931FAD
MQDLRDGDPREIGSFRLEARLGSGGMGTVYLARSEGRGEYVAVKTIKGEHAQEEEFRRRFHREAAAASAVRSPYTVRVIGFDTTAPEPWLATEYVDGLSLRDYVQEHGALGLSAVVDLGLGLTSGLTAIHKSDLVHRDLKPGNVLLTSEGPKIIDFGLVYASDFSNATRTGMVLGTPGYYSPEQVQGQAIGPASDVYSLGAVLVYASSGEHAFKEINALTAQYHVVHGKPDLSAVPRELRGLVYSCMRKDPSSRPRVNEVRAYLISLRDHGAGETFASFPWAHPEDPDPLLAPTVAADLSKRHHKQGRLRVAVSIVAGMTLLAAVAIVGTHFLQRDESSVNEASATPTASRTPASPTPSPSPSEEVSDEYTTRLIGSLVYDSRKDRCVMDLGAPVDKADGYSVTVTPVARHGEYLSKAVIKVRVNPKVLPDERAVVHVTFPKGEDTYVAVPAGKTEWSFTWPDQVSAQLPRSLNQMDPVELFGTYTVVVVHGTVQACDGFNGDIKGYSTTS